MKRYQVDRADEHITLKRCEWMQPGITMVLAADFDALQSSAGQLETVARDNHDSYLMANARLQSIKEIIDGIENRCMAADGPVTNTRHEMTDDELKRIYRLAGGIAP